MTDPTGTQSPPAPLIDIPINPPPAGHYQVRTDFTSTFRTIINATLPLTVAGGPPAAALIPINARWAMIGMSSLLLFTAWFAIRRSRWV